MRRNKKTPEKIDRAKGEFIALGPLLLIDNVLLILRKARTQNIVVRGTSQAVEGRGCKLSQLKN